MVTHTEILSAAEALRGRIVRTPLLAAGPWADELGFELWLKLENLQRGGAFKLRGATFALLQNLDRARRHGVVTGSSGNHGTAVALASRELGIGATVVMPTDAPTVKREAVERAGGRVIAFGRTSDERLGHAAYLAESQGLLMIPPYDHEDVVRGQGTVGVEVLQDLPEVDAVLVPCGGGGLLSGIATYLASARPQVSVFGVEAEAANDTWQSLRQGARVKISLPDTAADGMRNLTPGSVTFPLVQRAVKDVLLVSELGIRAAVRRCLFEMKTLAEPTGATSVAAAWTHRDLFRGRKVVAVVSGGNVDPAWIAALAAEGVRAG